MANRTAARHTQSVLQVYSGTVFLHIIGGAVGLLALIIPLVSPKGGRTHVRAGTVFSAGMAVSVLTGLLIALSWVAFPDRVKTLPDAHREEVLSQLRTFGMFFGLLSALAGHALIAGIGAIRNRTGHAPGWVTAKHAALYALLGLSSVVFVIGLMQANLLLLGFAGFGLVGGALDVRARAHPKPWVVSHLQAMLGCATVTTTAFVVQMVSRSDAGSVLQLSAWFAPAAVGHLTSMWWTRRVQPANTEPAS